MELFTHFGHCPLWGLGLAVSVRGRLCGTTYTLCAPTAAESVELSALWALDGIDLVDLPGRDHGEFSPGF